MMRGRDFEADRGSHLGLEDGIGEGRPWAYCGNPSSPHVITGGGLCWRLILMRLLLPFTTEIREQGFQAVITINFLFIPKLILLLAKYIANLESSLPMKSKHLPNGLFRSSTLIRSNLRELSGHRVKRF